MGRPERSIDDVHGPFGDFARSLRDLRREAGSPSYRILAQRTHFAASTLSTAAAGERLPARDVVLAYVRACGGEEESWRQRWERLERSTDVRAGHLNNRSTIHVSEMAPALIMILGAALFWSNRKRRRTMA